MMFEIWHKIQSMYVLYFLQHFAVKYIKLYTVLHGIIGHQFTP